MDETRRARYAAPEPRPGRETYASRNSNATCTLPTTDILCQSIAPPSTRGRYRSAAPETGPDLGALHRLASLSRRAPIADRSLTDSTPAIAGGLRRETCGATLAR